MHTTTKKPSDQQLADLAAARARAAAASFRAARAAFEVVAYAIAPDHDLVTYVDAGDRYQVKA